MQSAPLHCEIHATLPFLNAFVDIHLPIAGGNSGNMSRQCTLAAVTSIIKAIFHLARRDTEEEQSGRRNKE